VFDLHNHILPGVDDGPSTVEESVEMALMAYEDGTRTIVATPHNRDVNERSSISAVKSLVGCLNQEIQAKSIPLTVLLGMENHLEIDTVEQADKGSALPIEGTHYILIELPFEFYPFYAEEVLFKLQLNGLRPIVVHPERNVAIQEKPEILATLVSRGALAQVTAGSISGTLGRDHQKAARELLHQNLIHIIASDGHTARGIRTPLLSPGVAAVAKLIGDEAAHRMVEDIPQSILEDKAPDLGRLSSGASKKRWWNLRT
jgi:protein-tyrosine phosphatase